MADTDLKLDPPLDSRVTVSPACEPTSGDDSADSAVVWQNMPEAPLDAELVRLRSLLFSRELAIIKKMQEILSDRPFHDAQRVSDVLAEAIQMRAGDLHMSMALEPVVDDIVKALLRKQRNEFADSLFPLMGPSIRKSIAEAFRSMLESFSKSMEMAFSWKGLRWRFEAMRSGKPFSEIVMLHTLVYRVEQIFFTHSQTGISLSHATFDDGETQDADMVSAMFTAIQDFVRDCFARGAEGDLESLQLGEFTIIIEKTPLAYLACVVRGTPPATFREQLRATLEFLLVEYHNELTNFSGDTAPFAAAKHYLDPCFSSHYIDKDKRLPFWAKALPVVAVLALVGWGGYHFYQKEQVIATMRNALVVLRAEPGLLITDIVRRDAPPWDVTILKDELSPSPTEALLSRGLDPALFSFRVVPFISYDQKTIARRVEQSIKLPEGVSMALGASGTLYLSGTAPMSWIVMARDDARALPGINNVDISGLHDPMIDKISAMIKKIENMVIEFPFGKDTPIPNDAPRLQEAVNTLVELESLVKEAGFSVSLTVFGHADLTGSEKKNYEISQARARTVAAMLYARGSSMPIAMYGMGSEYPKSEGEKTGDQASRRVELRVHVMRSVDASPETGLFLQ